VLEVGLLGEPRAFGKTKKGRSPFPTGAYPALCLSFQSSGVLTAEAIQQTYLAIHGIRIVLNVSTRGS